MSKTQTEKERLTWALLASAQGGVGAGALRKLRVWLDNNQLSVVDFWQKASTWGRWVGWQEKQIAAVGQMQQRWNQEKMAEYLANQGIGITLVEDEDYPPLLKFIPDFAPVLFYRGDLMGWRGMPVAVVGTRKMSAYGEMVVRDLLAGIGGKVTIVSGMMNGVDETAHRQAIKTGLMTAAFLGYGLTQTWPAKLAGLKEEIVESGGVVMSEFAPWSEPVARNFPIRNRLVAGASVATLVVEAAVKSGSLITAGLALDYGREVMAVPGSIMSRQSEGCVELLKKGAVPVSKAEDIREVLTQNQLLGVSEWCVQDWNESWLSEKAGRKQPKSFADVWQEKVYRAISEGVGETEVLSEQLGDEQAVLRALSLLELLGEIEQNREHKWQIVG